LLKLVFYTKDICLRVRAAHPKDNFDHSCSWENKLEFIVSDRADFTMIWTSLLADLEPIYAQALVELVSARYPLSPDYSKLLKSCPQFTFKDGRDEWVFFGGTFNPWHEGHQSCLDLLAEEKLCLILPDRNPQKELRTSHAVSDILELSSKAKFNKNQFLVPTFLLLEKKNPTVEWIERLAKQYPEKKLSLLMGFDSFAHLRTWIRADELLKRLYAIYVVSRLENVKERKEALDFVGDKGLTNVQFLGNHPYEDLSSTDFRKKKKGN
jgi:nicotinic acid mononucleotide adenylyltransferase